MPVTETLFSRELVVNLRYFTKFDKYLILEGPGNFQALLLLHKRKYSKRLGHDRIYLFRPGNHPSDIKRARSSL